MKLLTVVLAVTSLAMAGTSGYLWQKLEAERQRADAEVALRLAQESRLQRHAQLQALQEGEGNEPPGPAMFGVATVGGPIAPAAPAAVDPQAEPSAGARMQRERMNPYSTPKGREMMRLFSKVGNKRTYADLIKQLGLEGPQAEALLNALADQQERELELFQQMRTDAGTRVSRESMEVARRDLQTQTQAQVASLLGADTAQQLAEYQASLGERMQVQQLAEQLDALALPLSEQQQQQLLVVMTQEKAAFPQPQWDSTDPKAHEAELDWREEVSRRVLARATSILSSDQHREVSEIQTWQTSTQRQAMNRSRPREFRLDNP